MKKIYFSLLLFLCFHPGWSQEFKLARNTGKLVVQMGHVTIEGYAGKEIVLTSSSEKGNDIDQRAVGLKPINSQGLDDNTGLGISLTESANVITLKQIKKINTPEYHIMVPNGMMVSYRYESQYGNTVTFINFESEIEVSAVYNSVVLNNVTGPMTVKSVYGSVEGSLSASPKGPISIVSVYGHCDMTLPLTIKADLRLSTSYGEIYVAPAFKIDVDSDSSHDQEFGEKIGGKLNGGGLLLDLTSSYGKIYLRKK